MRRHVFGLLVPSLAAVLFFAMVTSRGGSTPLPARNRTEPLRSLKLYVFDCGTIHVANTENFGLKKEEVATSDLAVPCFLVVHRNGTLLWDAGAVPDADWKPTGAPVTRHVVLPDHWERDLTLVKSLKAQMLEIGYAPEEVKYLAFSHYHYDHTANASQFTGATWLVQQVERDAMFADPPPHVTQPSTYATLRTAKTIIISNEDRDVFGDGTVVIKWAPGHTQGHQMLFLKLAKTGPVLLAGDLYHYPEERTLNRVPTFDINQDQTRASRVATEAFLKKTGTQLWIQHDFVGNAKLKKSPAYYD
jgi:N-acyl homoserine lactone hydrolase